MVAKLKEDLLGFTYFVGMLSRVRVLGLPFGLVVEKAPPGVEPSCHVPFARVIWRI
jgi:hypothetical protein